MRTALKRVELLPDRFLEPYEPLFTWFDLGGIYPVPEVPRLDPGPFTLKEPGAAHELTHLELTSAAELERITKHQFKVRFLTISFDEARDLERLPCLEGVRFLANPGEIPALKEVIFERLDLGELPPGGWNRYVEQLVFSRCTISSVFGKRPWPQLRSLTYFGMNLEEVPTQILPPGLVRLDLCNNSIEQVADLTECEGLQEVRLSWNSIKGLPEYCCFPRNLRHLRLAHNCLSKLPTWLDELPHLETLDLDGNSPPKRTVRLRLPSRQELGRPIVPMPTTSKVVAVAESDVRSAALVWTGRDYQFQSKPEIGNPGRKATWLKVQRPSFSADLIFSEIHRLWWIDEDQLLHLRGGGRRSVLYRVHWNTPLSGERIAELENLKLAHQMASGEIVFHWSDQLAVFDGSWRALKGSWPLVAVSENSVVRGTNQGYVEAVTDENILPFERPLIPGTPELVELRCRGQSVYGIWSNNYVAVWELTSGRVDWGWLSREPS